MSETKVRVALGALQDITWILLLVLTPLWVNLWGQQPFEYSKVMLARTLIWLLAALAAAEFLLIRRFSPRDLAANRALIPAGLLALVVAVTTATGSDWRLSLWGSHDRAQGALTLLTYLILFSLAAAHFRRTARAWLMAAVMALTAVPLILIGLAQVGGLQPLPLVSDARSPVFATLGRANFLAAYLVILLPLTLALMLGARQKSHRLLWAALFGGELLLIGLTSARAAWLAAAVALLLFALLWWGPRLARRQRIPAWSGLAVFFFSGPLAVLLASGRLRGSTAARLAIWQAAAELIRQRPLTGFGADSLGLVFPRVYPPQLVYYHGREFFVDRAHNLLLDWAVTAGIPGLLSFLLLLLVFLYIAGRGQRRANTRRKRLLLTAVLSAALANVANNLVSFDVTPTTVAFWLLMGMGFALASPPARLRSAVVIRMRRRWAAAFLLLLFLPLAVWQANGRPLAADILARTAERRMLAGEWSAANAAATLAAALWPGEPDFRLLQSSAAWQLARHNPSQSEAALQQAESALRQARQARPGDWTIWLHTAQFYASAARRFGVDGRSRVFDAYRRAAALAPDRAAVYTAWGRAYLEEQNPHAAAPLLRQALSLDATSETAAAYLQTAEQEMESFNGR